MAVAIPPALAVMIVPVAIVITPVGLGANRRARRCADNRANCRASPAADRGANAGTDTGAHKRAANRILRTGAGRHDRNSGQRRESKNDLPHDILQPLWICSSTPQQR
jgi:hypothetical protein